MHKFKITIGVVALSLIVSLFPKISLAETQSILMKRSTEILKFHAKKTETIDFSSVTGNLQAFSQIKVKKDKKKR